MNLSKCLCMLLALICAFSFCLTASAEDGGNLHHYLDIPYDSATPDMVANILAEQKGAEFLLHPSGVLSGSAGDVNEFGYLFKFTHDFNENFLGTYRISLTSAQPSSFSAEECAQRIPGDLAQYLDMEAQLTALYGEPDLRLFTTGLMNGKKYIRFMFPDGRWSLKDMQTVCDTHQLLKAYTVWGNVTLQISIDLTQPYTEGIFYSYIKLYYYPTADEDPSMKKVTVEEYRPL